MPFRSLKDLFVHELRDLHDAENQLLKALPRFVQHAVSEDLKAALEEHALHTRKHVARLDRIFAMLRVNGGGGSCSGMRGLIQEADKLLGEGGDGAIRDAGLIASAQRIEHYEIAAYNSARTFADSLGLEDCAWILTETLEDEREADQLLNSMVSRMIQAEVSAGSRAL